MMYEKKEKLDVLLVEDNRDHAHLIMRALGKGRYHVTPMTDGKEALAYLSNPPKPPHVVVLDYHLPSMDGLEILKIFENGGNKDKFAFIFLTVENDIDTAVEAMKAGAMDFISKTGRFYDGLPTMIEKTHSLHRVRQEQRQTREKLKASLIEKELLLREIHHRVKNNLGIIYSLLHFQENFSRTSPTPMSLETVLSSTRSRIKSMALVHEKLYKGSDLTHIDFAGYCRDLVSHLCRAFRSGGDNKGSSDIRCEMDVADIVLDIDTVIPCGLIINELVTNALKHAFTGNGTGAGSQQERIISVGLECDTDSRCRLWVSDNGSGLPEQVEPKQNKSLGMFVVRSLVEQLEGVLDVERSNGTTVAVSFRAFSRERCAAR